MPTEREKFYELLKDFDTAVLVTVADGSRLDARPMAVARVEPSCEVWFLTGADTAKVREIERNPRVEVVAQDEHDKYVTLSGLARVVQDREKIRALWKEPYEAWFPRGKDDPDIRLIAVTAEQGEYWDDQGANKVRYLFEAAKAYVGGHRAQPEEGEQHGSVQL